MHCEVPCYCKICGLLLTSAAHIMRTRSSGALPLFHNVFNPASFLPGRSEKEMRELILKAVMMNGGEPREGTQYVRCNGCESPIQVYVGDNEGIRSISVCSKCSAVFCLYLLSPCDTNRDCDVLIHETLMSCPVCVGSSPA